MLNKYVTYDSVIRAFDLLQASTASSPLTHKELRQEALQVLDLTEGMDVGSVLTDQMLVDIGLKIEGIEPGEKNGYILPVTFGRAVEEAVISRMTEMIHTYEEALTTFLDDSASNNEQRRIAFLALAKKVPVAVSTIQPVHLPQVIVPTEGQA
jgi:hypothetical protein